MLHKNQLEMIPHINVKPETVELLLKIVRDTYYIGKDNILLDRVLVDQEIIIRIIK